MNFIYIRNHATKVNNKNYNLQEIGFSIALANAGHSCDIVYFTDEESKVEHVYEKNGSCVKIYWEKGFKILDHGIYPRVLNKKFLKKYDYVITTEYMQIMTYLLTFFTKDNLILYHGPYKNHRKQVYQTVYDLLFGKRIRTNLAISCAKSSLAKQYLEHEKHFNHVKVLGVGLNEKNFQSQYLSDDNEKQFIEDVKKQIEGHKVLLYIGILEERRNIRHLLDVLYELHQNDSKVKLIIIGKGNPTDVAAYFEYAKRLDILDLIIYKEVISQRYVQRIYELVDIFLLPTSYEIFGMVLLESMYFGVPVITTQNGGSLTLIEQKVNGIIVDDLSIEKWVEEILMLLNDKVYAQQMALKGVQTIKNKYTWDKVAMNFLSGLSNKKL